MFNKYIVSELFGNGQGVIVKANQHRPIKFLNFHDLSFSSLAH